MPTEWRPIATDIFTTNPITGVPEYSEKWTQYDDDECEIPLAPELAEGEEVVDVETHLWRLKATNESADTLSDTLLTELPTVEDTTVKQRISGLTKDRVYRLFVEFGAAGNRRTVSKVLEVVG